ncbi:LacI family transcriptional regulator [Siculibacillus lacustris]|uniref:LacI family transcriptional regulator n=1 Tax=Siculibacillus lacustris TaxID=1549641 RepID=A0A4Q9VWR8_9HYPH|nr:LacI family DNA-binding transcriptional regulator [Siculibacillus lacustris]TBW40782.1 LacI family transcriptional regulator [Siculibacillus lacustris]
MDNPGATPKKRLTLAMIAERLDLSTATVSLALRNSPLVAEETRKRVHALAEELGYIYNRSAASLRTSRTNIVGLVVHDILNPYFAELVSAVETELGRLGQTVILFNHGDDPVRQRAFLETLLQYRADGMILCPAAGSRAADVERMVEAGLPTVLIARELPGLPDVPVIRGDDRAGIRAAVEHLIGLGHTRIALVGGHQASSSGSERRAGWVDALTAAGLPIASDLEFPADASRRAGRDICGEVLAAAPTAIVCFNDLLALGMLMELKRRGIDPGRDISLIGYDDIDEASVWSPGLTSVWNGQQEVGRIAALTLIDVIAGRAPEQTRVLVHPELRLRETVTTPKA